MPQVSAGQLLNMIRTQYGKVQPIAPDVYSVAAVTTAPSDSTGAGLGEPTDTAYQRVLLTNNSTSFQVSGDGVEIAVNLSFPQAQRSWGNVLGLAFFDGPSFVSYFEFARPRSIQVGDVLRLTPGSMVLLASAVPVSTLSEEITVPQVHTASDGTRYLVSVAAGGALSSVATDLFGPPTPPQNVTFTEPNVLDWTAPAFDGGSPINSYTLWWQANGLQDFLVLPHDQLTVTLPANPEAATYWLTADNLVGLSAPSNLLSLGVIGGTAAGERPTNYGEYIPEEGVTAGVDPSIPLTAYTPAGGVWNLTTAGQVIENLDIYGRVKPQAPNIVFRNCRIRGLGASDLVVGAHQPLADCVDSDTAGGPTLFIDCTLIADAVVAGVDGFKGGNFVAERCVVAGTVDGAQVYNRDATIKGCIIRDLVWLADDPVQGPEGTHNDCIQFQGGGSILTVVGNLLDSGINPTGSSNIGILVTADVGAPGGYFIESNYFRNSQDDGTRVGIPMNLSTSTTTNFRVRNNNIEIGRDDYHIIARSAIRTQVQNEPGNVDMAGGAFVVANGG